MDPSLLCPIEKCNDVFTSHKDRHKHVTLVQAVSLSLSISSIISLTRLGLERFVLVWLLWEWLRERIQHNETCKRGTQAGKERYDS